MKDSCTSGTAAEFIEWSWKNLWEDGLGIKSRETLVFVKISLRKEEIIQCKKPVLLIYRDDHGWWVLVLGGVIWIF